MNLRAFHSTQGAHLAPDGIPLHYDNLLAEYRAGLEGGILLDRSHEGRIVMTGRDRIALLDRISTNNLATLADGEGKPTLFTNANARILDRVVVYDRGDSLLIITEPGRGAGFQAFLQGNIFFGDQVQTDNQTEITRQFALHGPLADAVMESFVPEVSTLSAFHSASAMIAETTIFVARRKPITGAHWIITMAVEKAAEVWRAIMNAGQAHGLMATGSLTYNTLRIRAGRPAGRELSQDYIPLEVGLWDEVSFSKGCYTGQEIIARMESRGRLAKTIVHLQLTELVLAPASVYQAERGVGTLTSSAAAPDGEVFALAVIKTPLARPGQQLEVGDARIDAAIIALAGSQPATLKSEDSARI